MIGRRVNNYELKRLLGEGGTGMVYEAEHLVLKRKAAVKVLKPQYASNEDLVQRFINEARAANAIRHPNIIDIIDVGLMPEGEPYMMMEFLEGETLSARIGRLGRLGANEAMKHARQTASALAAAHAHGIVHRDLKPDNLFVVPDVRNPGQEYIKVLDFGIAKLRAEFAPGIPGTRTGAVFGTPAYMSPEQCLGRVKEIDHRSDIYSLGIILYEMLCGHPPFQGNDQELYFKHVDEAPKPPCSIVPEITVHLESVVLKALEKKPEVRIQTMDELSVLLEERTPIPTLLCEEITGRVLVSSENKSPKQEASVAPPEPSKPEPIPARPKPVPVPTEIDVEQVARSLAFQKNESPVQAKTEPTTKPAPQRLPVEESKPSGPAAPMVKRARSGSLRVRTQTTLSSALGQVQNARSKSPAGQRGWRLALVVGGAFVVCGAAFGTWLQYRERPVLDGQQGTGKRSGTPGEARPAAVIPAMPGPEPPMPAPKAPSATVVAKEPPAGEGSAEPANSRKEQVGHHRHKRAARAEAESTSPQPAHTVKPAAPDASKLAPPPSSPSPPKKHIRRFDPNNPYAQ